MPKKEVEYPIHIRDGTVDTLQALIAVLIKNGTVDRKELDRKINELRAKRED